MPFNTLAKQVLHLNWETGKIQGYDSLDLADPLCNDGRQTLLVNQ